MTSRAGAEFCTGGPYGAPFAGTPAVQKLVTLGNGGFIDGPVWVDGVLYFSVASALAPGPARMDRFEGRVLNTAFIEALGVSGLAVDGEGDLVATTWDVPPLSRFLLPSGTRSTVRADADDSTSFFGPNDVVLRNDGNIYFTDLRRDYLDGTGRGFGAAYRISPQGTLNEIEPGFQETNGITLSPDGYLLYVVSRTQFWRFGLAQDGSPLYSDELILEEPLESPDGMTVDCAGNVYVVEALTRLVRVFDPDGNEIGRFGGPEVFDSPQLVNLAFGGPERKTLFITSVSSSTAGGVYSAELSIPGLPY